MTLSFSRKMTLASAMLLSLLGGQVAIAQTAPSSLEGVPQVNPAPVTTGQPSQTEPLSVDQVPAEGIEPAQEVESAQGVSASCPPNQFASAFSDVLPTDWAYEAVNRLAIGEVRCFPIPTQQ
jgi:hypothetical protein